MQIFGLSTCLAIRLWICNSGSSTNMVGTWHSLVRGNAVLLILRYLPIRNSPCGHGRRKDFFRGTTTLEDFSKVFPGGRPKVVKFVFSHSKLRKQPFLVKFSKSRRALAPLPSPSDAHVCGQTHRPSGTDRCVENGAKADLLPISSSTFARLHLFFFQLQGEWTKDTAGGCANNRATYGQNPIYQVDLEVTSVTDSLCLFVARSSARRGQSAFFADAAAGPAARPGKARADCVAIENTTSRLQASFWSPLPLLLFRKSWLIAFARLIRKLVFVCSYRPITYVLPGRQ